MNKYIVAFIVLILLISTSSMISIVSRANSIPCLRRRHDSFRIGISLSHSRSSWKSMRALAALTKTKGMAILMGKNIFSF